MNATKTTIEYDDTIVRYFSIAAIFWGVVGMFAGLLVASQLNFFEMNFNTSWLSFGRLRPLHTNAAIFAFVGNMMFAGIYYSTQRLCKARLASKILSWAHFWGWQLIIVCAAITLPLGLSRGKEYAELIWPINILVTVVWIIFAINFFWTLIKRNEPTLYVAIWFYIATIVTVALLYVVNHLSIPTSLLHSYPVFGGVQDALVQWWYGHNAVAFFLTTPILGIMYYFVPKAVDRPVYSYRLSVVHFWSLVFIYIWAGPHHLLNTALPHWLQALGMLFSLMLWAPSWGGMLNGLLTIHANWKKLLTDPVVQFLAAGVTFYGMSTFEGPMLSIRFFNQFSHYSDWTIGHVHGGTLGWNGLMAAGMFYWMVPRLWGTKLKSVGLAKIHFWIALVGILIYMLAMYAAAGLVQVPMLNDRIEQGTLLAYPEFVDSLEAIRPLMLMRVFGGIMYFIGWILLVYNLTATILSGKAVNGTIEVYPERDAAIHEAEGEGSLPWHRTFINAPVIYFGAGLAFSIALMFGGDLSKLVSIFGLTVTVFLAIIHFKLSGKSWTWWYDRLIGNWAPFTILTFIAVFIGGAIQIIPSVVLYKDHNIEDRVQTPYTPLELAGRDIYVREGCYNCHSQQIRTLVEEVMRYGEYSRLGETIYDHPFQWGSKRTGPDLAREGGIRGDDWHYDHFVNPRQVNSKSNMPNYGFLLNGKTDLYALERKIAVQRLLGVPFEDMTQEEILAQCAEQAQKIVDNLASKERFAEPDQEIVALIAYIQALGKNFKTVPPKPQVTARADSPERQNTDSANGASVAR